MINRKCLFTLALALIIPSAFAWCEKPNVQTFVEKMVSKYHFKKEKVCKDFDRYPLNATVIKRITTPFESVSWHRYRNMFITERRIQRGEAFWQKHAQSLLDAEDRYGVDASVILAILAVESDYGKQAMPYKSLDALLTLSFAYPKRAKYFTSELEALMLLSRENHLDIHNIGGSYAGAIGMPQFMPSNYRTLAVASNNEHKPDITHNVDDAIMSIANYLHHFGWKHYEPAITPSMPGPNTLVLDPDHPEKAWTKHPNFKAILRYNTSPLYASAVALLSQSLEQRIASHHAQ